MMNRLLKNKKGVTILEGLIALGLLALVAGGTFGVLLSVSRKASQPDIREEMLLAIERANEQLQVYANDNMTNFPEDFQNGLCGNDSAPLNSGTHDIKCMLPAICDWENSKFSYGVSTVNITAAGFPASGTYLAGQFAPSKKITFNITCNGFTL